MNVLKDEDWTAVAFIFRADNWKKRKASRHALIHTDTSGVKDLINERGEEGEREIEADRVALKENRALTHFTVE